MLSLLLDEHLSPRIVKAVKKKESSVLIYSLSEWQEGRFLGASDETLLREALKHQVTLVTYDLATLIPLVRSWNDLGMVHSGLVFVNQRSIPSHAVGLLAKALYRLWKRDKNIDWEDRCVFLNRP
jgi:hypothetical protein